VSRALFLRKHNDATTDPLNGFIAVNPVPSARIMHYATDGPIKLPPSTGNIQIDYNSRRRLLPLVRSLGVTSPFPLPLSMPGHKVRRDPRCRASMRS
jgi:hypothetical protein